MGFAEPRLNNEHLKLKLWLFLGSQSTAMVTYYNIKSSYNDQSKFKSEKCSKLA